MNIRLWSVWVHPTRNDMVLTAPEPNRIGVPIISAYMDDFILSAAKRGGARIFIEQQSKGL